MTDDVVAELDAWLGAWEGPDDYRLTVQRARDKIVALRARCALHDDLEFVSKNELTQARTEALEEAAEVLEEKGLGATAEAIRALKDKGHG